MILKSYYCDICKDRIDDTDGMLVIKGKQRWFLHYESGWVRKKIHICKNCVLRLTKIIGGDKNE